MTPTWLLSIDIAGVHRWRWKKITIWSFQPALWLSSAEEVSLSFLHFNIFFIIPTKVTLKTIVLPIFNSIDWNVVPRIVVMLVGTTLQSIWIENGRNITRNNCLQVSKLPKLEVTDYYENMTLYISTVGSHPIIWTLCVQIHIFLSDWERAPWVSEHIS